MGYRTAEKVWLKRQRGPKPSWWLVAIVPAVVLAMVLLAGCNPYRVLSTFPDGSPASVVTFEGTHHDDDTINPTDKFCALVQTCINWDSPKAHYWHLHHYSVYMGYQGEGYWTDWYGDWHNFLNCELLMENPVNSGCQDPTATSSVRG